MKQVSQDLTSCLISDLLDLLACKYLQILVFQILLHTVRILLKRIGLEG